MLWQCIVTNCHEQSVRLQIFVTLQHSHNIKVMLRQCCNNLKLFAGIGLIKCIINLGINHKAYSKWAANISRSIQDCAIFCLLHSCVNLVTLDFKG